MKRGALHRSQHWWGLWDTPFKRHTHIRSPGLTESCILHCDYDPARGGAWGRMGGERKWEKQTEKARGRVQENVHWVIEDARSVWPRNDGPWKTPWCFPLCTRTEQEHTEYCRPAPPLLLSPLPFILHFPDNGCVFWTPPHSQAPFATLHQTSEFNRTRLHHLRRWHAWPDTHSVTSCCISSSEPRWRLDVKT